jgi:glycosyltransferase involved in cell wall biosynthesis/lauroyl/myristoyl acyltransferase
MSQAAIEPEPMSASALPTAAPGAMAAPRNSQDRLPLPRRLLLSTAVWLLYVPHLAIMKCLGPRLGPRWARGVGRLHWLLTFLGAQRSVRNVLRELHPQFETTRSVSSILRKHLELKHECFARFKLFNRRRCDERACDLKWELDREVRAKFDGARTSGKGLIIVGFHFGFFRLSTSALPKSVPWCDAVYLSRRIAHYTGDTIDAVADMALQKAFAADRQSGARIHYIDPDSSIMQIYRTLLAGRSVVLTADGVFAKDFVDVPFLGRKLRMPCGWARVAAATGANVLILLDTEIDHKRRCTWAFDNIQVADKSAEAIYRAVAESARILETFVRCEPWAWHPWQRVRSKVADDGSQLLVMAPADERLGDRNGLPRQANQASSTRDVPASGAVKSRRAAGRLSWWGTSDEASARPANPMTVTRSQANGDTRISRPRVAIVANSVTPYRNYLYERIVHEVPEVELWTLATHGNSYGRWQGLAPPAEIRPVMFGNGEPTIEQTRLRFAVREWRKFGRIIRWLKEHQVHAVICQGFGDVGRLRLVHWCHRSSIPCFITADCNICGDVRPGLKRILKHLVIGQAIRRSSGVMPCGEYGRLLFERYGGQRDKTFMFPLVSNLELFANTPIEAIQRVRDEYGLDPRRRRLLYCGRMMPVKRPDLTINAFIALADERPNWDLVMMGDGPLRKMAAEWVPSRLKDRVKWLGLIQDTTTLASVYAQCDAFVLPSDKEPWGMVLIEAAAAGLALITTDIVGASPELVSDGENGRVIPRGDLPALICALRDVTHSDHIDEMKRNSGRVLSRWLAESDPVDGFRAAMVSCGIIASRPKGTTNRPSMPPEPKLLGASQVAMKSGSGVCNSI